MSCSFTKRRSRILRITYCENMELYCLYIVFLNIKKNELKNCLYIILYYKDNMEKRLNKKTELYITQLKDSIREKITQMGLTKCEQMNQLLQYIYDYERLSFCKEDLQKRKRVKNFVPIFDRCCAKRASNEQCTRRKKEGSEYCGTHLKGTPHGIVDNQSETISTTQKVEVYAQDIQGIIYYIDKNNNVYKVEDIVSNKLNPKIIAKYIKDGDNYSIPEFNI